MDSFYYRLLVAVLVAYMGVLEVSAVGSNIEVASNDGSFKISNAEGGLNYHDYGRQWNGTCGTGALQSPINIVTRNTRSFTTKSFGFRYMPKIKFSVQNKGSAVVFTVADNSTNIMYTPEGTFKLLQFHFHSFSEHAIDGMFGPLEVHFVHANANATKLAVYGILFGLDPKDTDNTFLTQFADLLPMNTEEYKEMTFDLRPFLAPKCTSTSKPILDYYTYTGSLTTPACNEIVTWFVRVQKAKVSIKQVLQFVQAVDATSSLPVNNRLPKPMGNRKVRYARVRAAPFC